MNISNYGLYLSIWADSREEAKGLNVRLLNGAKASWKKYSSKDGVNKYFCTIRSALVSLGTKDFYVSAKNNSWFLMPANKPVKVTTKKATARKSAVKRVTKSAVQKATAQVADTDDNLIEL